MKNTTLFLLALCLLTFQLNAQDTNREEEERREAKILNESSSISLEELIKQKNDTYVITKQHVSSISGVHHIYLRQAINGIEVYGTESSIHIDKNGKVLVAHNKFLADIQATLKSNAQGISAKQAITSVARQMNYKIGNLQEVKSIGGKNKAAVFNKADISSEDIPVKLMYYYRQGIGTQLVWELSVSETTSSDWWNFRVDASTGNIIDKDNWTLYCNILGDHEDHIHAAENSAPFVGPMNEPYNYNNTNSSSTTMAPAASYRVFAMPVESPNHGTRTLVTNPENLTASPYGWHDISGNNTADYTNSRGNNVDAYDDDNANNQPDNKYAFSPGGNLIFDFPLNTNYSNSDQSESAAITNLFYWNNIIHDVTYQYGFDEASGNFQHNNYGKGGIGNDRVNAEAQDGSGTCNANFATPPDGNRPRMQMYVCDNRDGDLDNMVIVHEYGHGISNRLSTLGGQEQMGEGWSDYYGLMLTMQSGDSGPDSRGVGTWLIGEGPNGPGIRTHPYSTNFAINPHTYDDIKSEVAPHGVGSVWTAMLWEMTWELIAVHGFDTDFYNGSGGNNISLALVTEALKLQPSNPGFVDGRDAILAADMALYGGENQCAIWDAFARRGLGYSAIQGSSSSKTDGTEAFDLPPNFSSLNVIDEVCLSDGVQTGLSGGNPAGGVYSGPGVTDDGNGTTFTFDPSIGGPGLVTVTYAVDDFCTGDPTTITDEINVTNEPPVIICMGSGGVPMTGSKSSSPGVAIPDGNTSGVTVTMDVTEDVTITDLDVDLNITHSWVGDLIVSIKSPAGTTAVIVDRPGRTNSGYGCSGDDIVATLDDEAATSVENECSSSTPTINGTFKPNNPLSVFDGESTLGTWELKVSDVAGGLTGTLNTWAIDYDYEIDAPVLDVTLDGTGNATINAEALLYDVTVECGSYTVLAGDPLAPTVSFSCADVGLNTILVEVTNDSGASSTCSAVVNVIGNGGGGPLLCPGDITQDNDPGVCGAVVTYTVDSPAGCGGSGTITQTAGLASGSTFPIGTTVNTFEYDDGINPIETCSFSVTINDTEAPTAVCQNISVQLDASGNATITAADVDGGSSDNCAVDTLSISTSSFTCADIGTNNVTLTVTDASGNTSTCVAVVTVTDDLPPTITCPSNQTVDTDPGNEFYVLPDYFGTGEATAVDNCTSPVTITSQNPAAGTQLPEGVHTITLTAEDEYGNDATCTFELTVNEVLGIGDNNLDSDSIQMYPNPTTHSITLGKSTSLSLENLKIFDLRGRVIKTIDLRNMGAEKVIDVSELASATYFVIIQGKDGQVIKRLIKE